MTDRYTTEEVAAVPRTDAEVDSSMHAYVDSRFKRYMRSSLAGFLILLIGLFGAIKANNYETCKSRAANVQEISSTIGGILHRLDTANRIQYEKGRVTQEGRSQAHDFYQDELAKLPIALKCSIL